MKRASRLALPIVLHTTRQAQGVRAAAIKAEGFEMQGIDGYKAVARVREPERLPCDRHAAGATEKGVETMASTRLLLSNCPLPATYLAITLQVAGCVKISPSYPPKAMNVKSYPPSGAQSVKQVKLCGK